MFLWVALVLSTSMPVFVVVYNVHVHIHVSGPCMFLMYIVIEMMFDTCI